MRYFDNTRLKSFRSCPRKYYFRHIRHWVSDEKALPLTFGLCWHEAVDTVWRLASTNWPDDKIVKTAMAAFLSKWEEEGMTPWQDISLEDEKQMNPRTPGVAAEMLNEYVKVRRPFIQKKELLEVELPFAVPVGRENEMYVGRMDKVFRDPDVGIIVGEHKTTTSYKKGGPFRSDYIESWSPESQIDGYLHAAHMMYGKEARYVYVDAALVHKEVHDGFKFIPINRQLSQLDAWLWETHYIMEEIAHNRELLFEKDHSQESYLAAFPKNTNSCYEYMRPCPYLDLCKMVSNPETLTEPPEGRIVEKWSPFETLELQKIGLEPEEDD